jgi:hypothetical protein
MGSSAVIYKKTPQNPLLGPLGHIWQSYYGGDVDSKRKNPIAWFSGTQRSRQAESGIMHSALRVPSLRSALSITQHSAHRDLSRSAARRPLCGRPVCRKLDRGAIPMTLLHGKKGAGNETRVPGFGSFRKIT